MREEYLKELLIQTKWQHTFIFNDDYEKFIEVIADRATVIQKIEEINAINMKPWTDEEREVLQQIQALEEENKAEYMRQIQEAKDEVKKLNQLMTGHQQYMNPYGKMLGVGMHFDGGKR